MTKFSIVIPIYNVEKYLSRCLESVARQTIKDIEVILVDDGSPDNCGIICDDYASKDSRFKVIHKKNGGVSAARNDGLNNATGDWILFIDPDDWLEDDACEIMYNEGQSCNADVVIGDINRIDNNKSKYKKLFEKENLFTTYDEKKDLLISVLYPNCCKIAISSLGYGGPWNKAIKREFLLKHQIRFDVDLKGICDDRLFIATVYSRAKRIRYIDKAVYNYVLIENSITRSFKNNVNEINVAIFKKFSDLLNTSYNGESIESKNLYYIGNDKEIANAYNSMVLWRMEESIKLYYLNKKNKNSFKYKLNELRDMFSVSPYCYAINNVDMTYLSKFQKQLVIGGKIKSPIYVNLIYNFRKFLKKDSI